MHEKSWINWYHVRKIGNIRGYWVTPVQCALTYPHSLFVLSISQCRWYCFRSPNYMNLSKTMARAQNNKDNNNNSNNNKPNKLQRSHLDISWNILHFYFMMPQQYHVMKCISDIVNIYSWSLHRGCEYSSTGQNGKLRYEPISIL